jgi:hypothetical protein
MQMVDINVTYNIKWNLIHNYYLHFFGILHVFIQNKDMTFLSHCVTIEKIINVFIKDI